ncbi:DUF4268 domain-containing protein [Candidatus Poribacteria bacterium]|nr:DUF4268 domain-containing protein [Candidatus Poribacteria bacterium]
MRSDQLGRLSPVGLREIWPSESSDFTPWLAQTENIALLGETIGIPLEVEAREQEVGPFRADILCRNLDSPSDEWVLIENQLEKTDHIHLGQLLTYAAGLQAVTIVWVAERFTDEHRSALNWLNSVTNDNIQFFGLEIELWRIGDSLTAPKFNLVSKPDDWSRAVQGCARDDVSEGRRHQEDFWTFFVKHLGERNYRESVVPPARPQHALYFRMGRSGFWIATVASSWDSETNKNTGELRVELGLNTALSHRHMEELRSQSEAIESGIRAKVTYVEKEGVQTCRIFVRRVASIEDRSQWASCADWLHEHLVRFQKTFKPMIANLSYGDSVEAEEASMAEEAARTLE